MQTLDSRFHGNDNQKRKLMCPCILEVSLEPTRSRTLCLAGEGSLVSIETPKESAIFKPLTQAQIRNLFRLYLRGFGIETVLNHKLKH